MIPIVLQIIRLSGSSERPPEGALMDSEDFYITDSEGNYLIPVYYNALKDKDGYYVKDSDGNYLLTVDMEERYILTQLLDADGKAILSSDDLYLYDKGSRMGDLVLSDDQVLFTADGKRFKVILN